MPPSSILLDQCGGGACSPNNRPRSRPVGSSRDCRRKASCLWAARLPQARTCWRPILSAGREQRPQRFPHTSGAPRFGLSVRRFRASRGRSEPAGVHARDIYHPLSARQRCVRACYGCAISAVGHWGGLSAGIDRAGHGLSAAALISELCARVASAQTLPSGGGPRLATDRGASGPWPPGCLTMKTSKRKK